MRIDFTKIKKGDKVTFEYEVYNIVDPYVHVVDAAGYCLALPISDIKSHTPVPRPIEIGCTVQRSDFSYKATVKVINKKAREACIQFQDGSMQIVSLDKLKRID